MNKSVHQEEVTITEIHIPNSRASKYMKEKKKPDTERRNVQ